MGILDGVPEALFSPGQLQAQREGVAQSLLRSGLQKYDKQDYQGAIRDFQASLGQAPQSENAPRTAIFMANAYLRLDRLDDAVKAYRTAIKFNPFDDQPRIALGNLYFTQEKFTEAAAEYKQATRLNPRATQNYYNYGQALLRLEDFAEAEKAFATVVRVAPSSAAGYIGLGQVYAKMGRNDEAVDEFKRALLMDPKSETAHTELGYLLADLGREDEAGEQIEKLIDLNKRSSASLLESYLERASKPKILSQDSITSSFDASLGAHSQVYALDAYLFNANVTSDFTMEFQFSKSMDLASVINPANWRIERSTDIVNGGLYNGGLPISSTEATITPIPKSVAYDPLTWRATVIFSVTQNSASTATLDPSHLVFSFQGKDVYGNEMNQEADQFSGAGGIY